MPALIIDGKAVSERRRTALTGRVRQLEGRGIRACLAAVTVRPDGGWAVYQKGQATACAAVGLIHRPITLAEGAGTAELLELIETLNVDPEVHGIIVQNPLPSGFDAVAVAARIAPDKDVEGVGMSNLGLVLAGRPGLAPCTALSALALAQEARPDLKGVEAVVIGASTIVGKPVAALLTAAGATVTVCQITTKDVPAHARRADVLIVAVGRAGLVKADWVKPGAVVVDVGINRIVSDGVAKTVGDVDPEVAAVAGWLTPVPGGVGALTTTILLESTVLAAERLADAPNAVDAGSVARLIGGLDLATEVRERIALLISRHLPTVAAAAKAPTAIERRLAKINEATSSAVLNSGGAMLIDGAMGTELLARGVAAERIGAANHEHPDLVAEVHRAYVQAGAEALTTNTFSLNRSTVPDRDALQRSVSAGVRLARQAAGHGRFVLGSIGPVGGDDPEAAAAAYAEVALALADAQVDAVMLETMPSTDEAVSALTAIRRVVRLPVLVCRHLNRADDAELSEFARAMETGGAAAIGLNCSGGPRATAALVGTLARATRLPVISRPHAGLPAKGADGRPVYHLKPDYFARQQAAAIAAGAAIIGGCCGVGPAHIVAASGLRGTPVSAAQVSDGQTNAAQTAAPERSDQGEKNGASASAINGAITSAPHFLSGSFPVVTLLPARLPTADVLTAAAALAKAGATAIGLCPGWPGSQRSPRLVAAARAVQDHSGVPAVLELGADLSVAAAQDTLLNADLLNVHTILIDAGVFAPGTDALRLLWLVRRLNEGRDRTGSRLERATSFTVGVRLPTLDDRAAAYVAAGAAFITLQPVYDPAVFRRRMAELAELTVPVFAEALLLPDAATAEELDNELPALSVPPSLVERLAVDPTQDGAGVVRFLRAWRNPRPGHARLAGVVLHLADARTDSALGVLARI
jgi:methylenetetrahydrofolate dehydrogenase (NADP+)/methenyltetrahydrofolate cyclohydrolase